MKPMRIIACFILVLTAQARADEIIMKDGSIRWGTMVSKNDQAIQFRMERDGMITIVSIPTAQITRVIVGVNPPAPVARGPLAATTPATRLAPATAPRTAILPPIAASQPAAAATQPPVNPSASDAELSAYASRGFIRELLSASVGIGPDDLHRLPDADQELWNAATASDKEGKNAETLENLRHLEAAMHDLPDGLSRLDAICRRLREESFGIWMARIHWETIRNRFSTGQFDLADVREIERRPLIALLRKATTPALDPIRSYLPPIDDKTGQPGPFRASQLAGITVANALEVKDKALYAAAVVLAQLKLEPEMPGIDRAVFATQLANVNRVLARARDLEPLAKAAQIRAEQQKKAQEELARRAAAIEAQRAATRPK